MLDLHSVVPSSNLLKARARDDGVLEHSTNGEVKEQ